MRIAFAASHDLPLGLVARHALPRILVATKVLLRRPKTTKLKPGKFELMVAKMATILSIDVEWWIPSGNDRSQTFVRDLDMVGQADVVVAFFAGPALEGGTGHVVDAAMNKGCPVEAWWVREDGQAERIGEFNPSTDGP